MTESGQKPHTPEPREGREESNRSLRIVRTFMTQNMADEDILALSTGRESELARIIGAIERSRKAAPGTLQHVVLYGNRGFGKSFMTRRVQIEATKRWPGIPFALLPEEQHSLQRDPHALLDTIALKLRDAHSGDDTAYQEGHFRWPTKDDREQRWQEAETRVEQALDTALPNGGIAVVVVENFDILLRRLFKDDVDEQRLRRWLDRRNNRLMLFATATGTVDMDYDRPLFHAFESIFLEPWSSDECIIYFNRLRDHQGLEPLRPAQEAKARAVADFIGGTPRLAQLLGEVLETEDALDVAEIMAALTDRLADYYRRRIEDLAPLSTGLLDALIRGGEPASQTELAARVGADSQSDIARVMTELQKADIIRGQPAPDSREKLYRVPDRVFVHYYRLRQGNRTAQETPLATILDFLRSFYSRDEQRQQSLLHLEAGRVPEAGLFSRLAKDGNREGTSKHIRSFASALRVYFEAVPEAFDRSAEEVAALLDCDRPERAYELYKDTNQAAPTEAIRAAIRAQALYCLGHTKKARATLETRLERDAGDPVARFIVLDQLISMAAQDEITDAATFAEKLEQINREKIPEVLIKRGYRTRAWQLTVAGQKSEAAEVAARAALHSAEANDPRGEMEWLDYRAFTLATLGRYEEAAALTAHLALRAANEGDTSREAKYLARQASSLSDLGLHLESIEVAVRAAQRAAKAGDRSSEAKSLSVQAASLGELGRHQEAVEIATRAAQLASEAEDADVEALSLRYQAVSTIALGWFEEAAEVIARIAKKAAEEGDSREEKEWLLYRAFALDGLGRHQEAAELAAHLAMLAAQEGDTLIEARGLRYQAYSLSELKLHEEAVALAARGAQLAANGGETLEEAECLHSQAYSLNVLMRHKEAWIAAKASADLARQETGHSQQLALSIRECVRAAANLPQPEVVLLFDEWLTLYAVDNGQSLIDPGIELGTLFVAVARAHAWDDLDDLLNKRFTNLSERAEPISISRHEGPSFAQIASDEGRAAGYEAMAEALPRIAALMARLPEKVREGNWLVSIMLRFTMDCRDSGLLRDVAKLLSPDIGYEADAISQLLGHLADVDETKSPETLLARMNPDLATLIRRMRDLPEPKPPRVKKRG